MLKNLFPRLLISVVRRGAADKVVEIARETGASGSTVLFGRGASDNKLLRLLCLADVSRELVFTIAAEDVLRNMEKALQRVPHLHSGLPGFGVVVNVDTFFHLGTASAATRPRYQQIYRNDEMSATECEKQTSRILICVVVNAGLADDLMAAARDAGATGGTILRARGTSRDEDSTFFGITIVPEKELLMIMTSREREQTITTAIESCQVLDQPGVGVLFTLPVEKIFRLGLKNNV